MLPNITPLYFCVLACIRKRKDPNRKTIGKPLKKIYFSGRFFKFETTFLVRKRTETQGSNIRTILGASRPKPTFSCTHQFEDETEQKITPRNRTQGSKQGK